ncbi:unnamed protein product [Brugia timori]|uniref:Transcriptional regulator n=1 Tax=Brugia timori TaxID=42155 RepID=A0A0R3R4N8_9BILA|nr:unnamed protein product [Brugia timori]
MMPVKTFLVRNRILSDSWFEMLIDRIRQTLSAKLDRSVYRNEYFEDKKSSVDKFKEVLGFRYGFDNLWGFCKASGVFELSFSIESFGYKFSAMGSGFLSSHFSQQSVLKLPAIIVIIDASMNMKRLIDLQRIFCGAQLVELLVFQLFIFLTKRWEEIM